MIRRMALAGVAALTLAGTLLGAFPAHAAGPHGVGCDLTGTAKFTPGLKSTSAKSAYTFTGKFDSCQSTDSKLKTGTVKAKGSSTGTCANGTGSGVAGIVWNNGKMTALKFTTTAAGAVVYVASTVVPKVVIGTKTYTTNEPATVKNDQGDSALVFNADATKCTSTGITTATFQGPTASGAAQ
jgi:hypothetical protein